MIFCDKAYCVYSNGENCCCNNVYLDEDGTCETYEDYTELPDFQEVYFAAAHRESVTGKQRRLGKAVKYGGYLFYTQDNALTRDVKKLTVTESRTGILCGTIEQIERHWELFVQRISRLPSVVDLPEVESDPDCDEELRYVNTPTAAEMVTVQKYIDATKAQNGFSRGEL